MTVPLAAAAAAAFFFVCVCVCVCLCVCVSVCLSVAPVVPAAVFTAVDDAGEAFPPIDHSPWNGIRLADFVMPFFDFIVGVSLALSFKKFDLEGWCVLSQHAAFVL